MRSWWHQEEHRLAGRDGQWITLRRALEAATTNRRICPKTQALLEQSQILHEVSASLRAEAAILRAHASHVRRMLRQREPDENRQPLRPEPRNLLLDAAPRARA